MVCKEEVEHFQHVYRLREKIIGGETEDTMCELDLVATPFGSDFPEQKTTKNIKCKNPAAIKQTS